MIGLENLLHLAARRKMTNSRHEMETQTKPVVREERRRVSGQPLSGLNRQQKDAILQSVDHNVVLLAGAGSGKTHTLISRTEYLIREKYASPENIMLVTFTNKAANEIKDRMKRVSPDADKMWIGTFHAICSKLLRMFGHHIDIRGFEIMDQFETREVLKDLLKRINAFHHTYEELKEWQSWFSYLKNNLISISDMRNDREFKEGDVGFYEMYLNECWSEKRFDFDDLIMYTIRLLSSVDSVSDWVHDHLKYIMIDECQDSNSAQFALIKLLRGDNNIMLVGDSNQSIYGFRNAKPEYLEDYAKTTPNTIILKLEQNYRSTQTIVQAANELIKNNDFGTKLEMFCDNEEGEKIEIHPELYHYKEAKWVASQIAAEYDKRRKAYSDFAIIYRTNKQGLIIKEELAKRNIAYESPSSCSLDSHKEVKDLIAFCECVVNPGDTRAFRRALSTFPRIEDATINWIVNHADKNGVSYKESLREYMRRCKDREKRSLKLMLDVIDRKYRFCSDIMDELFLRTEYRSSKVVSEKEEDRKSFELMDDFRNMVQAMEKQEGRGVSREEMLDKIILLAAESEEPVKKRNAVTLMTAHGSKGLEYDIVFLTGAMDGVFPHKMASSVEEERRLFYVAMTRARKKLCITYPSGMGKISNFVGEIPRQFKNYTKQTG